MTQDKKSAGLYEKFIVKRTDGKSDPGQKHHGCDYFVLDLDHDPHAVAALVGYISSCGNEYPFLAIDLAAKLKVMRRRLSTPDKPEGEK